MWLVLRTLFNITYIRAHVPGKIMAYVQLGGMRMKAIVTSCSWWIIYVRWGQSWVEGWLENKKKYTSADIQNAIFTTSCLVWSDDYLTPINTSYSYSWRHNWESSVDTVQRFCGHLTKRLRNRWEEFADLKYREAPYAMFSNRGEIFARGAMFA